MWVHAFERTEFAIEKLTDHFAEPGIVLRKSGGVDAMTAFTGGQNVVQQIDLRAFSAAVDAFDGNESAKSASIYIWAQTNLNPG